MIFPKSLKTGPAFAQRGFCAFFCEGQRFSRRRTALFPQKDGDFFAKGGDFSEKDSAFFRKGQRSFGKRMLPAGSQPPYPFTIRNMAQRVESMAGSQVVSG